MASCKTLTAARVYESVFIRLVEKFDLLRNKLGNPGRGLDAFTRASDFGETTLLEYILLFLVSRSTCTHTPMSLSDEPDGKSLHRDMFAQLIAAGIMPIQILILWACMNAGGCTNIRRKRASGLV